MVRVPSETKEQAMGIAGHLPGVSAGQVLAQALKLQMLIVATIDEMGHHPEEGVNLSAEGLLVCYTDAVIARRMDVARLSARLAEGIEAEIVARAQALATEAEALWQEGARKALDELEVQTEERARVLAVEALPHMVTAAVRRLFNDPGPSLPADHRWC